MNTTFHCCFDLDYIVHRNGAREMAAGGIRQGGRLLTEAELLALAVVLKAKGFEVLPTCTDYDARGHCLGHATE